METTNFYIPNCSLDLIDFKYDEERDKETKYQDLLERIKLNLRVNPGISNNAKYNTNF